MLQVLAKEVENPEMSHCMLHLEFNIIIENPEMALTVTLYTTLEFNTIVENPEMALTVTSYATLDFNIIIENPEMALTVTSYATPRV